jgi:photosystem II stability/assembly factor-like uncharacterized protein
MTTKQVLPVALVVWGGLALWSLKTLRAHASNVEPMASIEEEDDAEDRDEEDDRGLTSVWSGGNEAFAVGERGVIWHSSDAGRVWVRQDTNVEEDLHAVFGVDGQIWAVGDEGTIVYQRAPGVWEKQASGVEEALHAVFCNKDEVWAAGDSGVVLRSRDHGATWHRVDSGTDEDLRSIAGAPGGVYVSGDNGVLKKLTATQAVSTTGGSPDPQG